ncbi:Hsp70 family protein [Clostridium perfringens]|uniref:Chaperone protein DnaK n=1 Tax=Clostridium perfringens TaxID=1502 RepID=A0AAW9I6R1_CLOPF|nr:Hsp70 family protein [Clostridium perfringens]MBI5982755.1 Hsp70 family protein [Clostridium perfringens]MBI5999348.1 Hsp70 family protein [Clostridium perfringens]MBI6108308.1 Hsp70 family protein [Clostridium perfringens]MDB2060245.1 Hsp70 family protein [Clostridium perfringens]MDB2062107.1 Hsp70 family protein [Clostridium perfringens]
MKEEKEIYLGIDLGTTNSIVSYYEDSKVKSVKFGKSEIIPSAIFFESKDNFIFGDKALKKMRVYPESGIRVFKRMLTKNSENGVNKKKIKYLNKDKKSKLIAKKYVIDTNVFINDPEILKKIKNDEQVILAYTVLEELSYRGKREETKYQAEFAIKEIQMKQDIIQLEEPYEDILPEGFFKEDKTNNNFNDNNILSIAMKLNDDDVYLLTDDISLQIKAKECGVKFISLKDFKLDHEVLEDDDFIEISGEKASEIFLSYLKKESEKKLGVKITKAVITVPANFNIIEIEATKRAGENAGFEEIAILKEPVAAGIVYGIEEEIEKNILVYDFGGGTFDVSILKVNNKSIEVIETGGNKKLGGEDITQGLINYIYDKLYDEFDINMDSLEDSELTKEEFMYNKTTIYDVAEVLKIDLSNSEEENVTLMNIYIAPGEQTTYSFNITKNEFEREVVKEKSIEAMNAITKCMASANLLAKDIDKIILAGGTSMIPLLQEDVKNYFGKGINITKDLATIVSEGAALKAKSMWGKDGIDEPIMVYESTNEDFGVEVGNFNFDQIIKANEKLPAKGIKEYVLQSDTNDEIVIRLLTRKKDSKELKVFKDDIEHLDKIIISGLPQEKYGIKVLVEFNISKEYTLDTRVIIKDKYNKELIKDTQNLKVERKSFD